MFRFYFAAIVLFIAWTQGVMALEDPTRPPQIELQVSSQQVVLPKLNSILFSSERKLAIINGKVLQEGDVGDGFKLIQIEADAVVVSIDGASRRLNMGGNRVHKEYK